MRTPSQSRVARPSPARPAPAAERRPGEGLLGQARAAASTTPGRMRVVSLAALAGLALLWVLGFTSVASRQGGIGTVGSEVGPLIVASQSIENLLSEADASAANSFLAGGVEPADQRARYERDIRQAMDQLAAAGAGGATTPEARAAIRTMSETVPVYAGLVEQARANNRQLFPVGAGYLRKASGVMHNTILPAAESLRTQALRRLDAGHRVADARWQLAAVGLAAVVLLGALAAAQVFLRRRTNRVFNVALVAATLLAAGLAGWILVSLLVQGQRIDAAVDRADALNTLAQARVTAFRAKGDESFALIARGNGAAKYQDFDAAAAELGAAGGTGLLNRAGREADLAGQSLTDASQSFQAYLAIHRKIQSLDGSGAPGEAISTALGTGGGSSNEAFARFDAAANAAVATTQRQFDGHIASARRRLSGLGLGATIGFVAAVGLVLAGFQQRIREYR